MKKSIDGSVNNKLIGKVVSGEGKYLFEAKDGCLYDIKQDQIAKRLAYSGEICIYEFDHDKNGRTKMSSSFSGKITDIIGKEGDPIPEGLAIAKVYNLDKPFTNSALRQAEALPVDVTPDQWKGYKDLRNVNFVTIDPDKAKDFDDAVYAEKNDDGTYTMMVAIANVANYIGRGTPLYSEIIKRGSSAYLGNTVYPMLPEIVSNGLCSLNEGEDRVVMCTTAKIDRDGKVLEYSLAPAVINSKHRLTYKQADYIRYGHCDTVDDQSVFTGLAVKTANVKPSIDALFEVADILTKERMSRGALDITSFKPYFELDNTGTKVVGVKEEQAEHSTKVIESSAILTNMISGEICTKLGLPTIYRNHILPDEMTAAVLSERLKGFGINLSPSPAGDSYRNILKSVKGRPIEEPVTSLILKAFREAFGSSENLGHFGLGIDADRYYDYFTLGRNVNYEKIANDARMKYFKENGSYNGFSFSGPFSNSSYAYSTSPIRDGSSYIIQRTLLDYIMTGKVNYSKSDMDYFADNFNEISNSMDKAEGQYNTLLGSIWANDHIGEVYEGRVVNFYPDGVLIKTNDPKNIAITIPYEEIKSKYITQSNKQAMLEYFGNRRPHNKHNKGAVAKCPIQPGDPLTGVIYDVSTNPPRIYASEDYIKYANNLEDALDIEKRN